MLSAGGHTLQILQRLLHPQDPQIHGLPQFLGFPGEGGSKHRITESCMQTASMQQSKHICQHEHMLRTLRPGALNQQYPDSALGGMLGQLLQEALVIVKTSEDIMGIVLRHLLLEKIRIKLAAQHTEPIGNGATPVGIMKIHLTICSMLKRCSTVAVNILIAVQRGQPHHHGP